MNKGDKMIEINEFHGLYIVKITCSANNLVKQRAFKTNREAIDMVQQLQLHVPSESKIIRIKTKGE